jgi:hypothetical protein|tara:strand:+ start:741 stop:953 length:213 start_codon:yes stop_codon:yes gene_type:complete
MSSQYKENNFSTENFSLPPARLQKSLDKLARPNIDDLIKKIHLERRKERRITITIGFVITSVVLIFVFFN